MRLGTLGGQLNLHRPGYEARHIGGGLGMRPGTLGEAWV